MVPDLLRITVLPKHFDLGVHVCLHLFVFWYVFADVVLSFNGINREIYIVKIL